MTLPDKLMLSLRFRASGASVVSKVIATFHEWIAARALDEVLIDVADYSHVPGGPGVVLVGYDHNYFVAQRGQQIELGCFRKRNGSEQNPLLKTLRRLLEAASLLQGPLRECGVEGHTAAVDVTVFDRKLTEHHPFRTGEFAWLIAEHLAGVLGARPHVTVASGTARPTVHAAWVTPTAVGNLLEMLEGSGTGAVSERRVREDAPGRHP